MTPGADIRDGYTRYSGIERLLAKPDVSWST